MIEAFFHFEFIQNAVIAGIVIGFIAPILGVFLVVRRLSMIADALSHITLSGIAFSMLLSKMFGMYLGWLASLNPIYMGMLFSVMGALSIEKLRRTYKHYEEIAIPIIMAAGIGFGVVFISMANGFNVDLFNYLFGSIIAIRRSDMITILLVGISVILFVLLFYKELLSLSFDEEHAKITGIPRKSVHFLFIIVVALVIASSMRIVGILLVSALMVLPVAASIKIAKSFKQSMLYSVLFGQIAVLLGLYLSFEWNWAPGGTIVIISFLILCVVISWKKYIIRED
ncbi:metal ABC transporter permease [Caldalkalibacillus mannanilyticus]|uniref:metal ABC transporter permease n=1 Tax=Caldalkalibacillus mannanilyticus TaxID=1418 RepID=UPI0004683AC3|nr:metal ABC transporter permease [Caldalkalibacillus mannanilyticus]